MADTHTPTIFHQTPSLRRSVIASYYLLVLLALPLWWHTTSIQRLTLPISRVRAHAEGQLQLPEYDILTSPSSSGASDQHVVPYSPRYRLSFSLLNEDASASGGEAITSWDITRAIRRHISPILTQLSSLHNFTIESQIQFHAPLAFKPTPLKDGETGFGLTQEQLTVFVNSAEWSLSSSASNDPVLHFVLFVPAVYHSPLRILSNHSSNAFLLPQWGTILLHNNPSNRTATSLSISDLDPIFHSFSTQLFLLLGAPSLPPTISAITTSPQNQTLTLTPQHVLTDWQLDALKRRRTLENLTKAKNTLTSIVKLVSEIENMPVGRDVRDDIVAALNELDQVNTTSPDTLTQNLQHSARALTLSSRAFFNPGMLALLYFPAEHKYAVYTPLFASAMIPMVVTAMREVKAWKMDRRRPRGRG